MIEAQHRELGLYYGMENFVAATQAAPSMIQSPARKRVRSTLDVTILVALVVVVLDDSFTLVVTGRLIPPVVMFTIICLIAACAVATGWRWSAAVSLLVAALDLVGGIANGYPLYVYTHPGSNPLALAEFSIDYPLLALVLVLSATRLMQNVRHEAPHSPSWLRLAQGVAAGTIVGALIIGASLPSNASAAATSTAGTLGTKVVHLTSDAFAPDIVALHTGDTLTLVGDAPVPHTLANGVWDASHHALPAAEQGAPTVNNVEVNNNTAKIGPFTTPGTYHIYCTVHPGMSLTIIVQ